MPQKGCWGKVPKHIVQPGEQHGVTCHYYRRGFLQSLAYQSANMSQCVGNIEMEIDLGHLLRTTFDFFAATGFARAPERPDTPAFS